jgi:hypothetical protein
MFILRRIDPDKVETNTYLDVYYTLVLKEKHKAVFDEATKLWSEDDLKSVYGLVCVEDIDLVMPLYSGSSYYIMTSEGKTFSNISPKELGD